jgi:hypothetical protein
MLETERGKEAMVMANNEWQSMQFKEVFLNRGM